VRGIVKGIVTMGNGRVVGLESGGTRRGKIPGGIGGDLRGGRMR